MLFTHCGKAGDAVQSALPIMSAYYKKTGIKPNLALAQFPYAKEFGELIKMQDCVGELIYIDYKPAHFNLGAQPYSFNIKDYIDTDEEVIHLGFRKFPDCYFGEFVAQEHGLDFDYDFVLNIGEKRNKYRGKTVVLDRIEDHYLANNKIKGEYLSSSNSILKNLQLAAGASAIKTTHTAPAILLPMAGYNVVVYGPSHLRDIHMNLVYSKLKGKVTWVNL